MIHIISRSWKVDFFIIYMTFYHLTRYSPLLALFVPVQLLMPHVCFSGHVCNCQMQNVVFIFFIYLGVYDDATFDH